MAQIHPTSCTRPCPSEDTGPDTRRSLPPIPASWSPGPSPQLAPSSPNTDPSECPHCLTSCPTKPAHFPWHLQPVLSLLLSRSQAPTRPADHAQAFTRLFALPGSPSSSPSHLTNPWHHRAPSRSCLRAVGRLPPGHPCSCHLSPPPRADRELEGEHLPPHRPGRSHTHSRWISSQWPPPPLGLVSVHDPRPTVTLENQGGLLCFHVICRHWPCSITTAWPQPHVVLFGRRKWRQYKQRV